LICENRGHSGGGRPGAQRADRALHSPCIFKSCLKLKGRYALLYTIAVILIVLWLLGLVTSYTMGGVIHILLVIAVVMILIQVIQGRRA
jgi:Family of unknown function (DUF5670)